MRHSPPLLAMLPMYYMYISRILSRLTGVRSCCYCAALLLLFVPIHIVVSFCWRCCSLSLRCAARVAPRLWMLMWMWMRLCGSFCCCQPWCSPTWASSLCLCLLWVASVTLFLFHGWLSEVQICFNYSVASDVSDGISAAAAQSSSSSSPTDTQTGPTTWTLAKAATAPFTYAR